MAKDLHKDNFEDFFRDTLKESSDPSTEENWDVPSEQVWEKIDQSINQEDDSDTGTIWFTYLKRGGIILCFLLLVFAGYLIFNSTENKNTDSSDLVKKQTIDQSPNLSTSKEKILPTSAIENDASISKNPTEALNDIKPVLNKENSADITINKNTPGDSSSLQNTNNQQLKSEKPTTHPESKNTGSDHKIKTNTSNSSETKTSEKKNKKKDIAQASVNDNGNITLPLSDAKNNLASPSDSTAASQVIQAVELLTLIPTKYLLVDKTQHNTIDTIAFSEDPFTDLNKKTESSDDKLKRFYVGISIAPTYTDRKVITRRNPLISRALNRNEKAQFSFNAGLQVGYQFSKNWSIESGFVYSKQSTQYRAARQVRYSMSNERVNSRGEFERDYRLDIETSSGDVSTDIALARTSSTSVPENDFINLIITTKQDISHGSIPLILRYQVGSDKWKFGLKAGLLNKFVLDGNSQIESVNVLRPGIRFIANTDFPKTRKLLNLKTYQAHYLVGAGVSYYFNDRCWVYAEPTFSRSFNPVFQNQNFKTLPSVSSLELGFNYLF